MTEISNPDNLSPVDIQNIKSQLTMEAWKSSILTNCADWPLTWLDYGIRYCQAYLNKREAALEALLELLKKRGYALTAA